MAFTSTETINILADIRSLRAEYAKLVSIFDEITATIDRLEYFLNHFDDLVNEEDLPL